MMDFMEVLVTAATVYAALWVLRFGVCCRKERRD